MDPEHAEFHIEEFKLLRTQVDAAVDKGESLLLYVPLALAAIYGWIAANASQLCSVGEEGRRLIAVALPVGVVLCLGGLGMARYVRVYQFGRYIKQLEDVFGAKGLGWQGFLESNWRWLVLSGAYAITWFIAFGAVIWLSCLMPEAMKNACERGAEKAATIAISR